MRSSHFAAIALCLVPWLHPPAGLARTTDTPLAGTFNNSQENACIHVSIFFYLADCSYARSRAVVDGHELPWVGPTVNPVYYAPDSPHADPAYRPKPGDDRIRPSLAGTLTIDDRNTKAGTDDRIAGTFTVGPAARSVVANINSQAGRPPRMVEKWQAIRHTLAPTAVDSATPNAAGGFDYVIGAKGFPEPLCRKAEPTDCFTSAYAAKTTDGPTGEGTWLAPGKVGIERDSIWGGGNPGATTTAGFEGYACTDDSGGTNCRDANVAWGGSKEQPGFDNLLLRVATDRQGRVLRAEGFWTHEYFIIGGPPTFQVPEGHDNSWQGGYLQLAPAPATAGAAAGRLPDLNPDPRIFETNLVAREKVVDLGGGKPGGPGTLATVYALNGDTPGPEFSLRVGQRVIVHFTNELPEPISIHWHGIELNNASDGTTLTQNPLRTGESYTYDFVVPRAGVFWYHSHQQPTNPEFKGLYGAFVVSDDAEDKLIGAGVLPDAAHSRTLVLADTTVCKAKGANDAVTFPADPALPWAFTRAGLGPFPGNTAYPAPRDLCEDPRDPHGVATGAGALPAGAIPNVQPAMNCGVNPKCRVNEGQLVLVNGRVPPGRAGSPDRPGSLADPKAATRARPGEAFRLRLVNAAVSRYFRLRLTDASGHLVMLYRVGGEGGLLDRVRVEGGTQGSLSTKFDPGELVLGPSERADAVFVMPAGRPGDVLTLWTEDFSHYGTDQYPYGYGGIPSVALAHWELRSSGPSRGARSLAAGDPLLTHPAVNRPTESLKALPVTAHLLDPATFSPPLPGSSREEILLTVLGLRESIDGVHATALHAVVPDYRDLPHVATSRYARVGDLLELTFRNGTQQHHPVHLHGFSFQPVRLLDTQGRTVYEYDYNEFVDSVDIPDLRSLVVRLRLDDRPLADTRTPGGAAGRWMLHCHIFNHAELGMMTELVVLPASPAGN